MPNGSESKQVATYDGNMPRQKSAGGTTHFFSIKSKLSSLVSDLEARLKIKSAVERVHEATKRALFFFKAVCLHCERTGLEVPSPTHSVLVACMEQVATRSNRGKKCKELDLLREMRVYKEEKFSRAYSDKVDLTGLSMIKALAAEQMSTLIHTDVTNRFTSRCTKLCIELGGVEKKPLARKIVNSAFLGRWDEVPKVCSEVLKRVIPKNPKKGNTYYDLKADPSRYFKATLKMCRELGPERCKFSFCPNDLDEFEAYILAKKTHDEHTAGFYLQEKWKGWKFRLFSNRKQSEDLFLDRVAYTMDLIAFSTMEIGLAKIR